MVPAAGALQRLAERVGRGRASRFVMLGEPISAPAAGQLGIAAQVVPEAELAQTVEAMAQNWRPGLQSLTRRPAHCSRPGGLAASRRPTP